MRGELPPAAPAGRILPALPRRNIALRRLLSAALLGLAGLSGWSAWREVLTRQAQQDFDRQTRLLDSGFTGTDIRDLDPTPRYATPRHRLIDALFVARAAATQPPGSPLRRDLLARARTDARTAAAARPHWGEAWTAVAYVESLSAPHVPGPDERAALIRSYDDAPYLALSGPWRLSRSLTIWSALPERTQTAVINEALWYICTKPDIRRRLFAEIRASAAYMPIFLAYGRTQGCSLKQPLPYPSTQGAPR